jgi:hypothetical protein
MTGLILLISGRPNVAHLEMDLNKKPLENYAKTIQRKLTDILVD